MIQESFALIDQFLDQQLVSYGCKQAHLERIAKYAVALQSQVGDDLKNLSAESIDLFALKRKDDGSLVHTVYPHDVVTKLLDEVKAENLASVAHEFENFNNSIIHLQLFLREHEENYYLKCGIRVRM